jgi:hypothetical protein
MRALYGIVDELNRHKKALRTHVRKAFGDEFFSKLDNSSLSHSEVGLAVFFVIAFVAAATS